MPKYCRPEEIPLCPFATGLDELYRYASDEQLKHVPPPTKLIMETYDVRIVIGGDENTKELNRIDPAKMVMRQQARTVS